MVPRRTLRKPSALKAAMAQSFRNPASVLTSPPPGSYDPAIDAQVGQAGRGLGDLLSDYIRDYGEPNTALGGRAGEDYGLGREGIERTSGRSLADLLSARSRAGQDFAQGRARAGEDHGTAIAGVQRGFAQLGAAQGQAARAAGVQRGGALAQALAKRQANEQIARAPIDTSFSRFTQDSTRDEGRFMGDSALAEGRLGEDKGLAFADLQRGYLRGVDDSGLALGRAGRENTEFGLDANASRFYQANMPLNTPSSGLPKVQVPTSTTPQAARRRTGVRMSPKRLVSTRGWG